MHLHREVLLTAGSSEPSGVGTLTLAGQPVLRVAVLLLLVVHVVGPNVYSVGSGTSEHVRSRAAAFGEAAADEVFAEMAAEEARLAEKKKVSASKSVMRTLGGASEPTVKDRRRSTHPHPIAQARGGTTAADDFASKYDDLPYRELQKLAKQRGLRAVGSAIALRKRLADSDEESVGKMRHEEKSSGSTMEPARVTMPFDDSAGGQVEEGLMLEEESKRLREIINRTCALEVDLGTTMHALKVMGVRTSEDLKLLGGDILEAELEKLGVPIVSRKRLRQCMDQLFPTPTTRWRTVRQYVGWALEDKNLKILSAILIALAPLLPAKIRRMLRREARTEPE